MLKKFPDLLEVKTDEGGSENRADLPAGQAGQADQVQRDPALEQLALEAGQLAGTGGAPGGDQAGQAEPPKLTTAEMIAGALTVGRDLFCAFTDLHTPKVTLGDQAVAGLATAWGKVIDKYQIDLSKIVGDYMLEIAAVMATLPIAVAVRAGVRAEIAAKPPKESKKIEGDQAGEAPGGAPGAPAEKLKIVGAATFTPGKIEPAFGQ